MKKIALTIVVCFMSIMSFSQISGFLGKRFILHYDFTTNASINEPVIGSYSSSYNESGPSSSFIQGFNIRHNIEGEWLLNKKFSVGGVIHFLNTSSFTDETIAFPENEQTIEYTNLKLWQEITAFSYGFSVSSYPALISPIGTYYKLEVFRIDYFIDILSEVNQTTNKNAMCFVDDSYYSYGLTLHVGQQKIYFNKISLRLGVQVGWIFDSMEDQQNYTMNNVVFYEANRRLRNNYVFNFNLGVGYLLF